MLADSTDGVVIDKTKNIIYRKFYEHVYNKKVSPLAYSAILITKYQPVKLNGKLSKYNGIDTDKDTLTDWDEVGVEYWTEKGLITYDESGNMILPTIQKCMDWSECSYVQEGLDCYRNDTGVNFGDVIARVTVLPIRSDPTSKDGDRDGISDIKDENPLHFDIQMYNNVPYYIYFAIKYSELDKKLGASMNLKKLESTDLLDSYDSEVYTTSFLGHTDYGYCSYNFSYKTEEEMKNLLDFEKTENHLIESLHSFIFAQNDFTDTIDGLAEVMGDPSSPLPYPFGFVASLWGIIRGDQDLLTNEHYTYLTYIYESVDGKTPICESVDIYGISPIDGAWRIERTYKSEYYTW